MGQQHFTLAKTIGRGKLMGQQHFHASKKVIFLGGGNKPFTNVEANIAHAPKGSVLIW
jgi:hypothetical protein